LLDQLESPLVLVLNEVNLIFEYPKIAQEFLPLLRLWHQEAKQDEIWQKFRLIVVHSTEVYINLNLNQSPFNVGIPIKLPEFSLEQVQDLAFRHNLNWTDGTKAKKLIAMVGVHLLAYKLESMGLVKLNGNFCSVSCDLYRLYFASFNFWEEDLQQQTEEVT
jgi:hypothetical protein